MASGGVRIAATINIITIAYRRYFLSISEVTSPNLARNKVNTGSSNTRPKANIICVTKVRYQLIDNVAATLSLTYVKKNLNPNGKTI